MDQPVGSPRPNIENNSLKALPEILSQCPRLETLRIKGNPLEHYPQVLTKIPSLRKISLGDELKGWKISIQKALPHLQIT